MAVSDNAKKLDGAERVIAMTDGTKIPIDDARHIDGDLFRRYE